jgi:DNA end-binding protein Ku
MAKKLISSMSTKWHPEKYKDEYKEIVEEWLEAKVKHHKAPVMVSRSRTKQSNNIVNFVELLRKSLKPKRISSKKPAKISIYKKQKKSVHRSTHH